jgi:hypothetical protein
VEITSKGVVSPNAAGRFVFLPLQEGLLDRDSGTQSAVWSTRFFTREGQHVEVEAGVTTYEGRRGTFEVRYRDELVDAGNGYGAITGTWRLVRGTGQYAGLTGGGRSAGVWVERASGGGPWSGRAVGFATRR